MPKITVFNSQVISVIIYFLTGKIIKRKNLNLQGRFQDDYYHQLNYQATLAYPTTLFQLVSIVPKGLKEIYTFLSRIYIYSYDFGITTT